MSKRVNLKNELLDIIKNNQENSNGQNNQADSINKLINELSTVTLYKDAVYMDDVYKGHWAGEYFNFGSAGGGGAKDQGAGVVTTLKTFSMGQLPDIPAKHISSALEIDPKNSIYNFYSHMKIGKNLIDTHHFSYGRFSRQKIKPNRFFVEFDGFEIIPQDKSLSLDSYCKEICVARPEDLKATLPKSPKLWSDIIYMDNDMRIQHGQLGGHYIVFKKDLPMYSINHKSI